MPAIASKSAILDKLHQLPALPLVLQEVIGSFSNTELGGDVLARKISLDQGLSARVLRVANSSFYGLPRQVGSVRDAVTVLGFDTVRSLVLSAGAMLAFPAVADEAFDRNAYWIRSFRVASYTSALAQCLGTGRQLAFTAGMFHDVGQLVFNVCIPELFSLMLAQQKSSGLSLIEVEQAELGFDHAEIGAEMAMRWNFPPEIEHAIRYWRAPEHEPFEPITGMVHVAALLEDGLRGDALMDRLPKILHDRWQMSRKRIEDCLPQQDQLDAAADLMLAT